MEAAIRASDEPSTRDPRSTGPPVTRLWTPIRRRRLGRAVAELGGLDVATPEAIFQIMAVDDERITVEEIARIIGFKKQYPRLIKRVDFHLRKVQQRTITKRLALLQRFPSFSNQSSLDDHGYGPMPNRAASKRYAPYAVHRQMTLLRILGGGVDEATPRGDLKMAMGEDDAMLAKVASNLQDFHISSNGTQQVPILKPELSSSSSSSSSSSICNGSESTVAAVNGHGHGPLHSGVLADNPAVVASRGFDDLSSYNNVLSGFCGLNLTPEK
ncbi:hypothetical protein L1049_011193 [Liquidambar formosana]|uniref:Uncharacterized protein n=1 Tax=Liquidambar formosana TaxID=63359 RepID=A0AAP0X1X0_LIQFO